LIDASLEMPDKVRDLQIKLYRKAKNEPGFRFYQLYDKVYREDILLRAWMLAKANDGAAGVDGKSFDGSGRPECAHSRTALAPAYGFQGSFSGPLSFRLS